MRRLDFDLIHELRARETSVELLVTRCLCATTIVIPPYVPNVCFCHGLQERLFLLLFRDMILMNPPLFSVLHVEIITATAIGRVAVLRLILRLLPCWKGPIRDIPLANRHRQVGPFLHVWVLHDGIGICVG